MKLKTFVFPNGQVAYGTENVDVRIDNMEPAEVHVTDHSKADLDKFFVNPQKFAHLVPHPQLPEKKK